MSDRLVSRDATLLKGFQRRLFEKSLLEMIQNRNLLVYARDLQLHRAAKSGPQGRPPWGVWMKGMHVLGVSLLLASLVAGTMAYQPIGQPQQLQTSPFVNPHTYVTQIYNGQFAYGTLPPPIFLMPGDELYVAVSSSSPVNIYTTDVAGYTNYMMGSGFNYLLDLSATGVTDWGYTVQARDYVELYVVVIPQYQGEMPILTVIRGSEYMDDQHLQGYRQRVNQQGAQIDDFVEWYQNTFDPDSFSYG